jgi:Replication Fork Protection Component Swi3
MSYLNQSTKRTQHRNAGDAVASSFGHSNIRIEDRRAFPSYDDSSQDEADEEEERMLSDIHGEAEEGRQENKSKRKKLEDSDKKIEDQYRKALKQPRKTRPKLEYEGLTGSNGLIRVLMEFPQQMQRYVPKSGKDISGAADYCRILMSSYERFTHDLMPSSSFEDTLWRIEQLGSNKQMREYLQQMRNDQRNKYLEKALGKEKAMKIIQELDDEMARLAQGQEYGEPQDANNDQQDPLSNVQDGNEHLTSDHIESQLQSHHVSRSSLGTASTFDENIGSTDAAAPTVTPKYHNFYKKRAVGNGRKLHEANDQLADEQLDLNPDLSSNEKQKPSNEHANGDFNEVVVEPKACNERTEVLDVSDVSNRNPDEPDDLDHDLPEPTDEKHDVNFEAVSDDIGIPDIEE